MRNIAQYPVTLQEKLQIIDEAKALWEERNRDVMGSISGAVWEEIRKDVVRVSTTPAE